MSAVECEKAGVWSGNVERERGTGGSRNRKLAFPVPLSRFLLPSSLLRQTVCARSTGIFRRSRPKPPNSTAA